MFKKNQGKNLDEYFEAPRQTVKINKQKIIWIAAIVIAALLLLLLVWGIFSQGGGQSGRDAVIIKRAGRHLLLPPETPAVVKLENSADLTGEQPFYQGAEKGDYLLIFTEARKAVIYSRKRDIIVNAGPIYAGQELEGLK